MAVPLDCDAKTRITANAIQTVARNRVAADDDRIFIPPAQQLISGIRRKIRTDKCMCRREVITIRNAPFQHDGVLDRRCRQTVWLQIHEVAADKEADEMMVILNRNRSEREPRKRQ